MSPQNGLKGLTITNNTAAGDLVLEGTLTGVSVEKSGVCGTASTTEGKYDLGTTVSGTNSEGATEGLVVESGSLIAKESEPELEIEASEESSGEEENPTYEIG